MTSLWKKLVSKSRISKIALAPRMVTTFLFGFSSGLPLLLVGGTLKAWMTESGVDLTVIGIFSLVGLPYTLKFLWAPFLDRFSLGKWGRRRGWLLATQLGLATSLAGLALCDPGRNAMLVASIAVVIAFLSASQDIVVDAFRREALSDEELGLGSTLYMYGYRAALYVAGALALWMADLFSWKVTYLTMSGFAFVGVLTTLLSAEPQTGTIPKTLREAVVGPFLTFFRRKGAWEALAFILLYKLGDNMAGEMLNPFYLNMGFTKTQIALYAKTMGIAALLGGGLVGGVLILKLGIQPCLWIFGILQAASTFCFSVLAQTGPSSWALAMVIGFENLTAGMGSAAFIGFMTALCDRRFTGTQFALLSSLMGVPRVIVAAPTGYLAKVLGWSGFFTLCTVVAIPGLLLLGRLAPWKRRRSVSQSS